MNRERASPGGINRNLSRKEEKRKERWTRYIIKAGVNYPEGSRAL